MKVVKGDRVVLSRVASDKHRGRVGTVKSPKGIDGCVVVVLDDGDIYRALPENIDKENARKN